MELRHLRYFLVLAEELHFGRAAERLHISQPPLSRQIQDLEKSLGTALFIREGRRVRLTKEGAWLRGEAETLLTRASWLERHLLDISMSAGHYSIGYTGSILFETCPDLLLRFREAWPDWTLGIRELSSEVQVKALLAGELDLGFVRDRTSARGLEYREISTEGLALIVPQDWKLPEDSPAGLLTLAGLPFIGLPRALAPTLTDRITELCAFAGFYPHQVIEGDQLYPVIRLVSRGLGWSIVPCLAPPKLELPVRSTLLSFEEGRHELGIIYRTEDRRGMAEFFEQQFRELSPTCG